METPIEERFGAAVRRHRERLEISQEAFAGLAGIHRTYASSIERGKVQISIGIAERLAAALGIPLSRIWEEIEREAAGSTSRRRAKKGRSAPR